MFGNVMCKWYWVRMLQRSNGLLGRRELRTKMSLLVKLDGGNSGVGNREDVRTWTLQKRRYGIGAMRAFASGRRTV
jgi:hypothetical protein